MFRNALSFFFQIRLTNFEPSQNVLRIEQWEDDTMTIDTQPKSGIVIDL